MKHKCINCKYQNWNGVKKGNQCYIPIKSELNKWTGITSETKYIDGIYPEKNNWDGNCIYFKSSTSLSNKIFTTTMLVTFYCFALALTWAFLQELGLM